MGVTGLKPRNIRLLRAKLVTKSLSGLTNRFIKSPACRPCIAEGAVEEEGRMLAEKAHHGGVINAWD